MSVNLGKLDKYKIAHTWMLSKEDMTYIKNAVQNLPEKDREQIIKSAEEAHKKALAELNAFLEKHKGVDIKAGSALTGDRLGALWGGANTLAAVALYDGNFTSILPFVFAAGVGFMTMFACTDKDVSIKKHPILAYNMERLYKKVEKSGNLLDFLNGYDRIKTEVANGASSKKMEDAALER